MHLEGLSKEMISRATGPMKRSSHAVAEPCTMKMFAAPHVVVRGIVSSVPGNTLRKIVRVSFGASQMKIPFLAL